MRKFQLNKKYRLKQDLPNQSYGRIPQGMVMTFICLNSGIAKFRLPNGKQITIEEKKALTVLEEP